jgi:hypothetical protein
MFKSEVTLANKAEHSGRTPISKTGENVNQIKKLIHENRCAIISNLANVL